MGERRARSLLFLPRDKEKNKLVLVGLLLSKLCESKGAKESK